MSLEYLLPSLWASLSSEELNNDMYSSFGTTYNRHLQSTLDLYLLMLRVYNHTHFKPITPTPVNTVVSASTIVEAVKKESGREKREGQGRFLGAFSKADSLRETLLERKNKKPRKVRHWKPNEVEEVDFNSSTALGRLNSTTSLLGRLGIEPSHTKVESFAADLSDGIPCTKENGEADRKCDGYYACDGINPDHVGCGSCNGVRACLFATEAVIGEGSCNGYRACHKTSGAEIEDQSCNGLYACNLSYGIVVEEGSCNVSGWIGETCALAPGAHIGKESCIGDLGEDPKLAKVVVGAFNPVMVRATLAMDLAIITMLVLPLTALLATTPAIVLRPAHLVREQFMMVPVVVPIPTSTYARESMRVCTRMVELARIAAMIIKRVSIRLVSSNSSRSILVLLLRNKNPHILCSTSSIQAFIGDQSCNEVGACFGVNGYEIGSCACNTDFECLCVSEEGEEGSTCDNSDGVFTDAQKSTCKSAKAGKGRKGDRGSASANIFSPDD
eukprot:scaffold3312_cov225-Alexandrium_tamarense.AAC.1